MPPHSADHDWLADLGLRPVINAEGTVTGLGGSIIPPAALDAMVAGARAFTDIHALHDAVGQRIAARTDNDAACVTSGAAAGLLLATAACLAGRDPARIARFPDLTGFECTEVIIHRAHRNKYDYAVRQTGARLVEIEGTVESLESAISPRTGAIVWFAGTQVLPGALPIEATIAVAKQHNIPVIVDAAAQIPPVSSLWYYTRDLGADLVAFSGGKGLRGPQSAGIVLGRSDLIAACRANGSPHEAVGRPLKVGKEEMLGMLAAVEWTLDQDEPALLASYEAIVRGWIDALSDLPGVTAVRTYPSEAGQPHGRAQLQLGPDARLDRDSLVAALWDGEPRIAVWKVGPDAIALNPQTLQPGEDAIVTATLRALLSS